MIKMSRIFTNTFWNILSQIIPVIAAVYTIPHLLREVGVEIFGVITLFWALVNFSGILDFGISKAITRKIAEVRGAHDTETQYVSSGLVATGCFGIAVAAAILIYKSSLVSLLFYDSSIPTKQFDDLVVLTSVTVVCVCLANGYRGALEGYEKFGVVAIIRTPLHVLGVISPLFVAPFSTELPHLLAPLVLCRILACVAFHFALKSQLTFSPAATLQVSFEPIRELLGYGYYIAVSNLISPIMYTLDRFFVSSIFGSGQVAAYTTPQEIVLRCSTLPNSLSRAMFPMLVKPSISNSPRIEDLHWLISCLICLAASMLIILLRDTAMLLWLGDDFSSLMSDLLAIFALGFFANSVAAIPYANLQARGLAKLTALLHLLELLAFVMAIMMLPKHVGVSGIAAIWSARCIIDCFSLLILDGLKLSGRKLADRRCAITIAGLGLLWALI